MKPKTLVLLAVAAGCGLVAMLGVQQVMMGQQTAPKSQTAKVIIARDNIDTGMKITSDNTKVVELPVESIPKDAIRESGEFKDRAAKVPMMAGDVIRQTKLTEQGEYGQSINIPAGMRVISIPVDDTHTVSGLLQPKDRVDVLVTYQARGERGNQLISKTKTLLEYVEVFNCGSNTATGLSEKANAAKVAKNIGLLVTPEQAGFVILAQRKGKLSLSWRRRGDDELAQTFQIDEKLMDELQGTVGIHDDGMPIYDGDASEEMVDTSVAATPTAVNDFLNNSAAVVEPPVVDKPMWTVSVYNGRNLQAEKFEIPEPATSTPDKIFGLNFFDSVGGSKSKSRTTTP